MIESCDLNIAGLQTLQAAQARIANSLKIISAQESISFQSALGRILSEDVFSQLNLPGDTNVSMDGYALNSQALAQGKPCSLHCCGTSWAGKPYSGVLQAGQCVRTFTGAVLPDGADTVVMQEQTQTQGQTVNFLAGIKARDNIRYAGEDIKEGDLLLPKGKKISTIDLGFIAAAGIYQIRVYRQLKIAYLSTGDELKAIGQTLQPGQLYDSNRYTLAGLLAEPNFSVIDLGRCGDDKQALKEILWNTSNHVDVLITTGGASVGAVDYIKQILDEIGQVNFWKIAMKPGKPLAFGKINEAWFFGLPGNPVSVIATFQQLVAPALQQLSGERQRKSLRLQAKCLDALKKIPGRQEFQRGILSQSDQGELQVQSAGKQGSHILKSASRSNCYIILAANCKGVNSGEWVEVEPLDRLI